MISRLGNTVIPELLDLLRVSMTIFLQNLESLAASWDPINPMPPIIVILSKSKNASLFFDLLISIVNSIIEY